MLMASGPVADGLSAVEVRHASDHTLMVVVWSLWCYTDYAVSGSFILALGQFGE